MNSIAGEYVVRITTNRLENLNLNAIVKIDSWGGHRHEFQVAWTTGHEVMRSESLAAVQRKFERMIAGEVANG